MALSQHGVINPYPLVISEESANSRSHKMECSPSKPTFSTFGFISFLMIGQCKLLTSIKSHILVPKVQTSRLGNYLLYYSHFKLFFLPTQGPLADMDYAFLFCNYDLRPSLKIKNLVNQNWITRCLWKEDIRIFHLIPLDPKYIYYIVWPNWTLLQLEANQKWKIVECGVHIR